MGKSLRDAQRSFLKDKKVTKLNSLNLQLKNDHVMRLNAFLLSYITCKLLDSKLERIAAALGPWLNK